MISLIKETPPPIPQVPHLLGFTTNAPDAPLPDGVARWLLGVPDVMALSCSGHADRAQFMEHSRACHALLADYLPLRGPLPEAAAMQAYLTHNRAAVTQCLAQTAGCFEAVVTLTLPQTVTSEPSQESGRAWLADRAAAQAQSDAERTVAEDLSARLVAALGALLRAHRKAYHAEITDISVLVHHSDRTAFLAELGRASRTLPLPAGATCRVSGPWPPFSFAPVPPLPRQKACA